MLDKFIGEGYGALSSFAKIDRVNFDEKEAASIYYGIMACAAKLDIALDAKDNIESATNKFLSDMSWCGFTDFSYLLTTCHAAQTHTFRLVALMAVPTNLRIGMERQKPD